MYIYVPLFGALTSVFRHACTFFWKTSAEISKISSELNEKMSEISRLQMELNRREDENANNGAESLKRLIATLQKENNSLKVDN